MKRALFLFLLLACAVFPAFAQNAQIRISVLDKDQNAVTDLLKEDLSLQYGKTLLTIDKLERSHDKPLAVTIMLDNSVSQERVFPISKVLAGRVVRNILGKNDLVSISLFSNKVTEVQPLTDNKQDAAAAILKTQVDIPQGLILGTGGIATGKAPKPADSPQGSTSIWDAVASAGAKRDPKLSSYRNIVILLTDGVNTAGTSKIEDSIRALNEAGTVVYSIGVGDSYYGGVEKKKLEKLSESTGGRAFSAVFTDEKDFAEAEKTIVQILEKFEKGLSSEYLLTFTPSSQLNKDSKLKLTITNSQKKNYGLAYPEKY